MSKIIYPKVTDSSDDEWHLIQDVSLDAQTAEISFSVPANAKIARIQGVLVGHDTSATRQTVQFNGDTGTNYDYLEAIFSSSGASTSQTNNANEIPLSSLWAGGEQGTLEFIVKTSPALVANTGHAVQIQTYTSGLDSHHHSCQWDNDNQITSILFTSGLSFANGYGAGTRLSLSVKY